MSAAPRIGVLGAGGRMGRILIQAVHEAGYQLAAAVERPESSLVGTDAGELAGIGSLGVKVVGSLEAVVKDCDVIIDFTAPVATVQHLKICREAGVAIVIGTTGMNDEQKPIWMTLQHRLLWSMQPTILWGSMFRLSYWNWRLKSLATQWILK